MAFTIEKQRKEIAFSLEKEKMEADRKVVEAKGITDFQRIVTQGITPDLIKWNWLNHNAKVVIFGDTKISGRSIIKFFIIYKI